MISRTRFARWCVMAFGMASAVACGHGQVGQNYDEGEKEHVGEQSQAVTLAWPPTPVVSAGKVGTLPGSGGVGPAGDYHYTLPIDVPPGRAGMTPSLSLSYSSTAGNGLLGVGWSLRGGISSITPCSKTIAVDGFAEARSALCMDGARLVDIGNGEWRTEYDRFARITKTGSGNGYKVELKNGRLLRYTTPMTGLDPNLGENFALTSEEDRDGNAINYHYEQTGTGDSVHPWEIYLKEVGYGKDASYLGWQTTGSRRIVFTYDTARPDPIYSDILKGDGIVGEAGFLYTSTAIKRRLQTIRCYAPGPEYKESHQSTLAWTYALSYSPSTTSGRSILTSVKRTGALGGESFVKQFAWQQTKGGTYTIANTIGPFDDPNEAVMAFDVDNDGKDELLVASTSLSSSSAPVLHFTGASGPILGQTKALPGLMDATFRDARVADMLGDGVPEILAPDRFANGEGERPYILYQWSETTRDYHRTSPAETSWTHYLEPFSFTAEQPIFLADFDADGLPDLVQARHLRPLDTSCALLGTAERPKCLAYDWYYTHNTGNGTFDPIYIDQHVPIMASDLGQNVFNAPLTGSPFASLSTLNGAGRVNLIASAFFGPGVTGRVQMMSLAPGDSAPKARSVNLPSNPLCTFGNFQGRGAYQQECFDPVSVGSALLSPKDWRISALDVDADGRTDLLAYNFNIDASGHFHVVGLSYRVYYDVAGVRHQDPITQVPMISGDFDGDGVEDAYIYDRSTDTSYIGLQAAPTRDLMIAVAEEGTALIPSETVTYSQRWSPEPVKPIACKHPLRCIRHGMNVVVEHDVYQGESVNAYEHHIYSYDDPRTDVHGRGFVGFATVREWNPDRPSEMITTYDNVRSLANVYQAFFPTVVRSYVPVDPMLGKREGTDSLLVRVSQTESKYEHRFFNGGKSNFVYRSSWVTTEWEDLAKLDWTPAISNHFSTIGKQPDLRVRTGSSQIDNYGNETQHEDATTGGIVTVVNTEYDYRFSDWLINLVQTKRTTVKDPSSGIFTPQPKTIDYGYDTLGHLTSISVERSSAASPEIQQTTELEYVNSNGLVTSIKSSAPGEALRSTHIEYDPEEGIFPRKTWNGLGHTSWSLYHPTYGTVSDLVDTNGVETQFWIDDFGRTIRTRSGGGAPVTTTYSPRLSGTLLTGTYVETSGDGLVRTRATLDSFGRVTSEEHTGFDYNPIIQRHQYDVLGRLIFSSRPHAYSAGIEGTFYTYDPMDRLRTVVAPDLSQITYTPTFWRTDTYGPVHNPAGPPVPGYVPHHSYIVRDVDGRIVTSAQISAQNTTLATTFAYGDFNQLRTVTDPNQNVTTIRYDQRGRRTQIDDPDTGASVLHYNGFSEVTSVDLPSVTGSSLPSTTNYVHDVLGRITGITSPDGASNFTWDTALNGIGQLASRSGPDGTIETFAYDALGRPQQRTWNVHGSPVDESFDILLEYDGNNRLKTLTYPQVPGRATRFKTRLNYSADTLQNQNLNQKGGYLQGVTEIDLPLQKHLWTVNARNEENRLLIGTTGNQVTENRIYEPATGRLSKILSGSNASPIPVTSIEYTYWPDGAVKSRTDSPRNRIETFDYDDGLSRLTAWHLTYGGVPQNVRYRYDPIGNLDQVAVGGSVTEVNTTDSNHPHALGTTQISGIVRDFKYDVRGRQYEATNSKRKITFNEFNLPKTITTDAGTTTFDYDASGGRVKKTDGNGLETITLAGLYERRTDNGKTQHIFYVPGSDGNLTQVSYTNDGTTQKEWHEYVHPDALGSAVAITDDVKGVTRFDSDPFGKRIQPNGAAFTGLLPNIQVGFTGHQMDDDLGLVNMKGRIYDPSLRRFLSPDPLVARPLNAQSYNRYSYVYNNPLNLTDPSGFCGQQGEEPCGGDGAAGTYCDLHPEDPNCGGPNWTDGSGPVHGPYTEQPCNGNTALPGCGLATDNNESHPKSVAKEDEFVFELPPVPPPPAQYHAVPVPASSFFDITAQEAAAEREEKNRDVAEYWNDHPDGFPWWSDPDEVLGRLNDSCPTCVQVANAAHLAGAVYLLGSDVDGALNMSGGSLRSMLPGLSLPAGALNDEEVTMASTPVFSTNTWQNLPTVQLRVGIAQAQYGAKGIVNMARPFDDNESTLVEIAKRGQRTGISRGEANILMEWAQEYNMTFRDDILKTHWIGGPHIHIGPVNHIPVSK